MISLPTIRRILHGWHNWKAKRKAARTYQRLCRENPELRRIDEAQAEAKRLHKKHSHFDEARRVYVTALLRKETL